MRMYPLGAILPRFTNISSSTNANPSVVTTSAPHGLTVNDIITVTGHLVNTAINSSGAGTAGSYSNLAGALSTNTFTIPSPMTISLNVAGNGAGTNTGTVSASQSVLNAVGFPTIPGVADKTKIMVARMLFIPAPAGTASLFIGSSVLNQSNFQGVVRAINPPPANGIYDFYDLELDGTNAIPLAEYYVDSAKPGTEGVIVTFWIR